MGWSINWNFDWDRNIVTAFFARKALEQSSFSNQYSMIKDFLIIIEENIDKTVYIDNKSKKKNGVQAIDCMLNDFICDCTIKKSSNMQAMTYL